MTSSGQKQKQARIRTEGDQNLKQTLTRPYQIQQEADTITITSLGADEKQNMTWTEAEADIENNLENRTRS